MNEDKKIDLCVGITQDNELYFLEITPKSVGGYFSMSGRTLRPVEAEKGEKNAKEQLKDGESWKFAVDAGRTTLGLNDWVDLVLNTDGWESQFDLDNSLGSVAVDGRDYYFDYSACGQHEEENLKEYFIFETLFKNLMRIWKKYHLKKANTLKLPELPKQDIPKLLNQAVRIIEDLPLLCVAEGCENLQGEDGEYCKKCFNLFNKDISKMSFVDFMNVEGIMHPDIDKKDFIGVSDEDLQSNYPEAHEEYLRRKEKSEAKTETKY